MATVNAYDRMAQLAELNSPYDAGSGSVSPATQRANLWKNITGDANIPLKGMELSSVIAVAVPSITDPDDAGVAVDVSTVFTRVLAVGDAVIAIPQEALPANALQTGAYVVGADSVQLNFASVGGNVTGANKNYRFLLIDLT